MAAPVLILTGPPGVGKTTAAATLAQTRPRSVHLETDFFFRSIVSDYVPPWLPESQDQNQLAMGLAADGAAAYARAGYFTVVEGIVIPRWFLAPLRETLREAGLDTAYAVLRAPLDECLGRITEREGLLPERDAIAGIWEEFADLGEHEGHAVEVSGCAAAEIVQRLEQRLADGSLTL